MVIVLELELEALLKEMARQRGVTPEDLVVEAVRDRYPVTVEEIVPRDDWERQVLAMGIDCGVALTDRDLSSEGLY